MKLFVDALTVIDSSLLHPLHGLSADSWICDLVLEGALDSQSMVMDFGRVKKQIKRAIDEAFDHVLLVPEQSEYLTHCDLHNGTATLTWCDAANQMLHYQAPTQAIRRVEAETITIAALQQAVQHHVQQVVPETVERVQITLRHEPIAGAFYHYSHGLKKHDGNCQRMAHGHRSRLHIIRNGVRDAAREAEWAARLNHHYLGTAEDVIWQQEGRVRFGYDAPQGRFELELPEEAVYGLTTDSTVECIATHIAAALKAAHPADGWVVRAFEGVQKGAIAES